MKVFNSISDVLDHLQKTDCCLPFPIEKNETGFEWMRLDDNKAAIIPSLNNINSLYVYRGQNQRVSPCVPSLFRGTFDQLELIIYKTKLSEFESLLKNPRKHLSSKLGLNLNVEALAQHYGLKTFHLDVTQSLNVASFFACCELNDKNNWVPKSNGVGVIYRTVCLPELQGEIVGVQVYPRPKEQVAHSIKVDVNQDFEKMPMVIMFEFKHVKAESERILNKFNYGKTLFPDDPLHDKALKIKNCTTLAKNTLRRVMKKDGLQPSEIKSKIKEVDKLLRETGRGMVTDRNEFTFNQSEKKLLKKSLSLVEKETSKNVGFRVCYSS